MTPKNKWILSIIGVLLAGTGYAGYRYFKKQAALLEDYDITPIGVKVLRWDKNADMAILEFTVRISNKAAIEATITKLYSDVYLNDQYVGYVNNNGNILIPGKGAADAKLQVTFAPKQVLKNLVSTIGILLNTKDVPYRLKGYARLKSSFIAFSIPFDQTRSLKKDLLVGSVPVIT